MTTSYPLSIRLKELGSPQVGGEYYWVKSHGGEIYRVYGNTIRLNGCDGSILCRTFTLGELVRELGVFVVSCVNSDYIFSSNHISMRSYSPEEAAGELWAELLKQEKQQA